MTLFIWSGFFFLSCYLLELFAHWLITGSITTRFYPFFYALPALSVGYACSILALADAVPLFLICATLMVTAITDLHYLLIHRAVTLGAVPLVIAYTYSICGGLSAVAAVASAAAGYLFLWILKKWFFYRRGIDGLGQGDLDLAALIGALVGLEALFTVITLAATSALVVTGMAIYAGRATSNTQIPFGTFLAYAALMVYCLG